MALSLDPGTLLNVLSGIAFLLLGLALVALDPRLRANLAVGLFSILWGAEIVAANLPTLTTDEGLARVASLLSLPLILVFPLAFLAVVASIVPERGRLFGASVATAAGFALVGGALLLLDPATIAGEVVTPDAGGAWAASWGPALPVVASLPFTLAFIVALRLLGRAWSGARGRIERRRYAVFLGALLLYTGYRFPEAILSHLAALVHGSGGVRSILELTLALVGAVVLARFLVDLAGERAVLVDPGDRREAALLLLAGLVPVVFATAGTAPLLVEAPQVWTLGLFRLLMVGLLVYGAARYQLLGLELNVRRASPGLAAALAPFLAVPAVGSLVSAGAVESPTTVAVLSVVLAVPLALGAHTMRRSGARDGEAQRLVLYATALTSGEQPDALGKVRRRLGVSRSEHDRLAALLRGERPAEDVSRDPRPGDLLFGAYEVEAVLAETARGPALLARDLLLDRPVVLKPLGRLTDDPAQRAALLAEGRAAARLSHPNVVEVFKVERRGDELFLVTEHLPGGDLRARVERSGPLPEAEALAITTDVLAALAAVHASGVVHRDVTPGNVFLDETGRAKLGDFGLAATTGHEATFAGTLVTAAPEQLTGGVLSERTDVFSAGALLYFLLTGRCHVPLEGRAVDQAVHLVTRTPSMLPLPGVARGVNRVLATALAREPAERFESARAMQAALLEGGRVAVTGPAR